MSGPMVRDTQLTNVGEILSLTSYWKIFSYYLLLSIVCNQNRLYLWISFLFDFIFLLSALIMHWLWFANCVIPVPQCIPVLIGRQETDASLLRETFVMRKCISITIKMKWDFDGLTDKPFLLFCAYRCAVL